MLILLQGERALEEKSLELKLNTDVVNNRTETYSSLTDIYGIPIFSNELEGKVKEYKEEQAIQRAKTEQQLFIITMNDTTSDYEQIKEQLFMQTQGLVIKNNTEITKASPIFPSIILGIMTVIFAVSLIKIINQKKRVGNYADSDNRGKKAGN